MDLKGRPGYFLGHSKVRKAFPILTLEHQVVETVSVTCDEIRRSQLHDPRIRYQEISIDEQTDVGGLLHDQQNAGGQEEVLVEGDNCLETKNCDTKSYEGVDAPRRSTRVRARPAYFDPSSYFYFNAYQSLGGKEGQFLDVPDDELIHFLSKTGDPVTYDEAIMIPEWRNSVTKEISDLHKNGTFELVPKDVVTQSPIRFKWVFKTKSCEKKKSRLTACGYSQREGVDYEQTYSLVANSKSILLYLFFVCLLRLHCIQVDISQAFVSSEIDATIYMQVPQGLELLKEYSSLRLDDHYVRLLKSLYGLKQASFLFYSLMSLQESSG